MTGPDAWAFVQGLPLSQRVWIYRVLSTLQDIQPANYYDLMARIRMPVDTELLPILRTLRYNSMIRPTSARLLKGGLFTRVKYRLTRQGSYVLRTYRTESEQIRDAG